MITDSRREFAVASLEDWDKVIKGTIFRIGEWVALIGGMGLGKTTFVMRFVATLQEVERIRVTSPTFDIYHVYPSTPQVIHYDLFRTELLTESDLANIDWEGHDWCSSIVFVEWPERLPAFVRPPNTIIEIVEKNGLRQVSVERIR